jgi:predicted Zn-dependent protease
MPSRRPFCLVALLFAGCTSFDPPEKTAQVSSQFFDSPAPGRVARSAPPVADDSTCLRVDYVGRKVLAANPQIGMKPAFATIQSKDAELFHIDQRMIYITDGLVKQLPSEADLAAALSYELARMVAEREARIKQDQKQLEPRPPIGVPIGDLTGNTGRGLTNDIASQAELARYDQARKASRQPVARPNPDNLSRDYLEKAGFTRTDFDHIQAALQAAARNTALERQVKGFAPTSSWSP